MKILSSHDIVFNETFYNDLTYTSHPYSEALATQPALLYIPYATYVDLNVRVNPTKREIQQSKLERYFLVCVS